jgi:hypothetical protein
MRLPFVIPTLALCVAYAFSPVEAGAQSALNLKALAVLAPFSALPDTPAGTAALAANYAVTGAIQDGTSGQPNLEPFDLQRGQALRDAFITSGNALELADGLGTKLGAAYRASASYTSADDGKTSTYTNASPSVANLIAPRPTTTICGVRFSGSRRVRRFPAVIRRTASRNRSSLGSCSRSAFRR